MSEKTFDQKSIQSLLVIDISFKLKLFQENSRKFIVEFLPGRGKFCNDLIPLKVFQETTSKDVDIAKAVLYNKNLYQTTLQIIHNVSPANDYRSLLSPKLLDEIINVIVQTGCGIKNKYTDGINYLSSIFILEGKNIQKPYLNNLYRKEMSSVNLKK